MTIVTVNPLQSWGTETEPWWGHITTQRVGRRGGEGSVEVRITCQEILHCQQTLCGDVGWHLGGRKHLVGSVCTNMLLLGNLDVRKCGNKFPLQISAVCVCASVLHHTILDSSPHQLPYLYRRLCFQLPGFHTA